MGRLFGTDGIRGIANVDLTCELAMKIGKASAIVLSNNSRRRALFVIGMDTRISSQMLNSALICGLCSVGADVLVLGVVPTPAVAYLIGKYKADAGIMISASHNSAEFNGIKIFSGDGYKLPDELENQIEEIILNGAVEFEPVEGANVGKVTFAENALKDYITHLKSTVSSSLEGFNIAVDCANGSASVIAPELMKQLGVNATFLFNTPDGININKDCGSTHIENLQSYVKEHKLDLGVAFDGDADRCLCIDENGNLVDGDFIIAICAKDMQERGKLAKDTVIGTIITNLGLTKFCEENNLKFIATKVGDRFILEEMLLDDFNFGGEQSGHIIFRDYATTGDGELTAIQLLSIMKRKNKKLSELSKITKKYPQASVDFMVSKEAKIKFFTNNNIKNTIENYKKELGTSGKIIVRPSGTEPKIRVLVDGENIEEIERIANAIANFIKQELE